MANRSAVVAIRSLAAALSAAVLVPVGVWASQPAQSTDSAPITVKQLSAQVWQDARAGMTDQALALLHDVPADHPSAALADLRAASDTLNQSFQKREEQRTKKVADVEKELDEHLKAEQTPYEISKALKSAVEWQLIATDKDAVTSDPRIKDLVKRADAAARDAEKRGDWLISNELFARLNMLLEQEGTYRDDAERVANRLTMIRLYQPERFWQLRSDLAKAEGEDPLPPYNGLGEDFRQKLDGIDTGIVIRSLLQSARDHVDRTTEKDRPLFDDMIHGGLENVRTLLTTQDLAKVFTGMADKDDLSGMLSYIDAQEKTKVEARPMALQRFLAGLLDEDAKTVGVPATAILHEFGDGAMGELDRFSAIIWPDELRRFQRMTQGQFKGVGIEIQMDTENQMIKVVRPLEGTPASRAGIMRDDLIKKIDGKSAIGISLDQAVDQITGPEGTKVDLTVQRGDKDLEFELTREVIPLHSVKGWRRTGPKEEDWDWFIDHDNGIGYVRLMQFTEDTSKDLIAAINEMKKHNLRGLILDLRFNPGGLLTEAVAVANVFINHGDIVSTEGTMPSERRVAVPGKALLDDVPVAVLINEGSASASEIVSGAIRYYADKGDIHAILVGERSYGKGSVQNVWGLQQNAALKLTTQYYKLPSGKIIHRKPGATEWGVEPHVHVEMLPDQISEALKIRRDADIPAAETGAETSVDPDKLIKDGIDLQLQTALVLLQTQTVSQRVGPQVSLN